MRRMFLFVLFAFGCFVTPAWAHEVRPGYLELKQTGEETYDAWASTDGVTWTQTEGVFPPWSDRHEMDFGAVVTSMPQSTHMFWVTTDGETWHQVEGPPGSHEPAGAGYSGAGAAGSILYTVVGEDGGPRVLWIGRFVPNP